MNKTAVHAIIMVLTTILAKVLGFCREAFAGLFLRCQQCK